MSSLCAQVMKWQHAAESAAGIAEQAKAENEHLKIERRETDARGDQDDKHSVKPPQSS